MGYTTTLTGQFKADRPFTTAHAAYLTAFVKSRRFRRDPALAEVLADPVRLAAELPIGLDGGYYVGGADRNFGQDEDHSTVSFNDPPTGQPGLWCGWSPGGQSCGATGTPPTADTIGWDGSGKFYSYVEWLVYLMSHFLLPWGYVLNGHVEWQGEDPSDRGSISVENNNVFVVDGAGLQQPVVKLPPNLPETVKAAFRAKARPKAKAKARPSMMLCSRKADGTALATPYSGFPVDSNAPVVRPLPSGILQRLPSNPEARQIVDLIPEVVRNHADQAAAAADREAAEVALFAAVLDALQPALPALVGRIPVAVTPKATSGGVDFTWAARRGFFLVRTAGPTSIKTGPDGGYYTGRDAVLLEDGFLQILRYSGSWDTGRSVTWTADVATATPLEVLQHFRLEAMLVVIGGALIAARGDPVAIALNRARANRVRAVLALLGLEGGGGS